MHRILSNRLVLVLFLALWNSAPAAETIHLWGLEFVPQRLPVAGNEKALASADVDEDGHIDLIVIQSHQNEAVVYLGKGDGEFRQTGRFPAGQAPTHFSVTDIDIDGRVDLVIANHETSYLTLLLGDGKGAFSLAPNSPLNIDVNPHPHVAHVYDINGDAIGDLIVDSRTDHGLIVLEGIGDGRFKEPGKLIDMGGDPYLGVAVGDINGDNLPDLISPNEDSIGVALNTSLDDISFHLAEPVDVESPFALALADIDADGILDLVVASDGRESYVHILKGDGRGRFKNLDLPMPVARGAKSIAVGDINGDGAADALVTSWSSGEIIIIGGPNPSVPVRVTLEDIENPWGAIVADLNGDGFGDLTIADGVRPVVKIYMSRSAAN